MEVKCSFKKLVGGNCGLSKWYKTETNVIPLVSCKKDISGHRKSLGISDVESEIELILARASVFVSPPDLTDFTVCPAHRYSLGIGWRRGSHRCRVPAQLCKHGKRAKPRKADRGIRKALSNIILRNTGIFLPCNWFRYVCEDLFYFLVWIFLVHYWKRDWAFSYCKYLSNDWLNVNGAVLMQRDFGEKEKKRTT